MRSSRSLLLLPLVLACSKPDGDAASDTAAATAPANAPAAPAALRAADVSGTWQGTTLAAQGDSVLSRWTSVMTNESTGKMIFAGMRDSIPFRTTFDGDSVVIVSEPYTRPSAPRGPKAVFRSTGRLRDGKLSGTVVAMQADKPDSVVSRSRWEATRAP